MTRYAVTLCLILLAACGADGVPQKPGLAVTGEVGVGVVLK
jgi:hypothetical protein